MTSKVEPKRSENVFEDFKPAYSVNQAMVEANRCLYCEGAPCITACPTHINIPEFIRKIATGNVKASAKTIFEANILGMSCARVCPVETLCVGDCVYNEMDVPPIQIGKLQRFATDQAFEEGWTYFEAGTDTGKKVALVGGGPASIAAAHELRLQGHRVTMFEKREVLGGLNTFGVAPYKMRADRAVEEVNWILDIGGIDVQTGVEVGKDVTFAQLEADYDAIFIGFGLGPDTLLAGKGSELEGVHGAVDYIEAFKLGDVSMDGVNQAVVLGGGNTAVDAVRELMGLGCPVVYMVYRGDEDRMSGYAHEWKAARTESVRAIWRAQPLGYQGADGKVTGVTCIRMDEHKKPIDGTEFVIDADLVLLAIGQSKLDALLSGLDGLTLEWGRLVVDDDGYTGRPGYYAGGDCANGGMEVVNAVAEGKRAAGAINRYLMGG
jgi:dihydropyrimidine dehydrogenase (NAD+) subunit PreT